SYINRVISESIPTPRARSISDYCKLPPVYYPPGFKAPKYRMYDGTSDPRHHLSTFVMDSQPFMHNKALLVHLFQKSLEGEALMWFASLTVAEMVSFDIVAERFMSHFDYLIPQPPTLLDLVNEKMSPDEDFLDFAIRWQDMASRSEAIIPESQA